MKPVKLYNLWLLPVAIAIIGLPTAVYSLSGDRSTSPYKPVVKTNGPERISFDALRDGAQFKAVLAIHEQGATCDLPGYFHGTNGSVRLVFTASETKCGIDEGQRSQIVVPIDADTLGEEGSGPLAYVLTERYWLNFSKDDE